MLNRTIHNPMNLDPAIEAALRTAPLAPAPPLLYATVMQRVRRTVPRPVFRLYWLDLALSLFAPLMAAAVWLAVRSIQSQWLKYLALLARWQWQKLLLLDPSPLLWGGLGMLALVIALAAAAWSFDRLEVT